ncbi:MAG: SRPBCC family protein [bacterium]
MTTTTASIIINKPIAEVFEYMASPHNGPAFIPNLNENTNIFPEQDSVGQVFDWRYNMAGVDLRGKATVTEYSAPNKVVIESIGDANSNWTYALEEAVGGTKVSVVVQYNLSETALQRISNKVIIEKLSQQSTNQMLDNLKVILES